MLPFALREMLTQDKNKFARQEFENTIVWSKDTEESHKKKRTLNLIITQLIPMILKEQNKKKPFLKSEAKIWIVWKKDWPESNGSPQLINST